MTPVKPGPAPIATPPVIPVLARCRLLVFCRMSSSGHLDGRFTVIWTVLTWSYRRVARLPVSLVRRHSVARVVDSLGPLTERQRDALGRLLRRSS